MAVSPFLRFAFLAAAYPARAAISTCVSVWPKIKVGAKEKQK
jgi:hypothetical protein